MKIFKRNKFKKLNTIPMDINDYIIPLELNNNILIDEKNKFNKDLLKNFDKYIKTYKAFLEKYFKKNNPKYIKKINLNIYNQDYKKLLQESNDINDKFIYSMIHIFTPTYYDEQNNEK